MSKNKKRGIFLIIFPFALLIGTSILQMLVRFLLVNGSGGDGLRLFVNIISLFAGVIAVVGMLPCIIIGIVLLAKPEEHNTPTPFTSPAPKPPEVPNSPEPPQSTNAPQPPSASLGS